MTDLLELWAERDRLKKEWTAFVEEAQLYTRQDDPVLAALSIPAEQRTAQQQQVIEEYWERRTGLLEQLREAERLVRVATGHEKDH